MFSENISIKKRFRPTAALQKKVTLLPFYYRNILQAKGHFYYRNGGYPFTQRNSWSIENVWEYDGSNRVISPQ